MPIYEGEGDLSEEGKGVLDRVRYRFVEVRDMIPVPSQENPDAAIPGLSRITGRIAPVDGSVDFWELFQRNAKLIVHTPERDFGVYLHSPDGKTMNRSLTRSRE